MTELSVVIITFNEAKNIRRAIESALRITDDVVIWDSFSTDQTPNICAEYPVRFIQNNWEGYSISKNKANAQAKLIISKVQLLHNMLLVVSTTKYCVRLVLMQV